MKNFLAGALALLVVLIIAIIIIGLGSWVVSILLNVVLVQLGLGSINMWGVICLSSALYILYKYITWYKE